MLIFDVSHLGLLNSAHQKLRKPCSPTFYLINKRKKVITAMLILGVS